MNDSFDNVEASTQSGNDPVSVRIERWKRRLIDQTRRNQLLNYDPKKRATVEVVDEVPQEVLRRLVAGQEFGFDARPDGQQDSATDGGARRDDRDLDRGQRLENLKGTSLPEHHTDNRLQTLHTENRLERNLLHIHRETEAKLDDEGINSLFLGLGMVEWYEDPRSDEQSLAPLIMVPVELTRPDARKEFSVSWPDEEILLNPAIVTRFKTDFNLEFPELPELSHEVDTHVLFEHIRETISEFDRWELISDIALGLFDFRKYLMYRDLDEHEQQYRQDGVIQALCKQQGTEALGVPDEVADADLDDRMAPWKTVQPLDADSSQQRAMLAVREGYNLVIEGPPGTGKSQTISNLIADQLHQGNTVLFVSEKAAALEVVESRLESVGLGNFSLELHSHKASKPEFTSQLRRALDFDRNVSEPDDRRLDQLREKTERLQKYVDKLHEPVEPTGWAPFEAIARRADLEESPTIHAEFPGVEDASADEYEQAVTRVRDLASSLESLGNPETHPLRGFQLENVAPARQREVRAAVEKTRESAAALEEKCRAVAERLGIGAPDTIGDIRDATQFAKLIARAPSVEPVMFDEGRVAVELSEAKEVLEVGMALRSTDETLENARERGRLVYILLFVTLLPALYRRKRLITELQGLHETARRQFGPLWEEEQTDWVAVRDTMQWLDEYQSTVRKLYLSPTSSTVESLLGETARERGRLAELADDLEGAVEELTDRVATLSEAARADLSAAELDFETGDTGISALVERLSEIEQNLDTLRAFSVYRASLVECEDSLAEDFAHRAIASELDFQQYAPAFRKVFLETWLEQVFRQRPVLRDFRGDRQDRLIDEFRDLDEASKEIARRRVTAFLEKQRGEVGREDLSDQLQLVRKEAQKKSKIMPIRKILRRAPDVVRLLQPCCLMSPLSVAKYTDPEAMEFDVVIFDEASQIPPADAVGSIIRGDQVVVVGDSKQLPPTSFFGGEVEDYDELQEQGMEELEDLESILDEAKVSGLPSLRLKWHYRSEDESLIRFSNEEFYSDDPLYTFPSAARGDSEKGLTFEYLEDVVYEGGGVNEAEARRVADAVVEHIQERPDLSLGVGTFGMQQRTRILDELERRRRENSSIEWFFNRDGEEKFFVKNLENIQGDDRDVIFISVTYGPDEDGQVSRNFGPINQDGGWRRLNVLTTRAKKQVRVFSSMRAEDISVQNISEGAKLLRKYLKYAETGEYPSPNISRGSTESPFERAIAEVVESLGYRVVPQVGEAGFRIDLGVLDLEYPGRYICGIECDGASYHSAATVRDRDRIRQQVLEDRGWRIHRIWSTDWFHDPKAVRDELKAVLEEARRAHRESASRRSDGGDRDSSSASSNDSTGNANGQSASSTGTGPEKEPESEFEREVGQYIEELGWEIDRQLQVREYRVDIAVRDQTDRTTYLCGIECDGASHHRGDAKRSEDAIREQELGDAGLELYRVWSTDWKENRRETGLKLEEFLEEKQGTN